MARALIDRNRAREARRQALILDRLAGQFRGRVEGELAAAMRAMIDMWEHTSAVIMPQGFRARMEALYTQMATAAVEAFGRRILEQGKAAGLVLEVKDAFDAIMRNRALDYVNQEAVRRRITDVTETTRRQIITAVDRGYRDGLTNPEISQSLRGLVGGVARVRANTIARTETHGAANFGSNEAALATGLPLKREWLAAHDLRTRTVNPLIGDPDEYGHLQANGQIVGKEQPFLIPKRNGGTEALMYPGDPKGSPGNTVNCRCTLGYIVDDGLDDEEPIDAGQVVVPPVPPAPTFAYETAVMPTTAAEAAAFVVDNGIGLNARLDGMKIPAMAGAMRAAMEVTERFELNPLTGVGPITRFNIRPIKGANAAIQLARMADNTGAVRNVSFLHLPVKFGDLKEYASQNAISLKSAPRYAAKAAEALKALETAGKVDPLVLSAFAKMETNSFSWTYDSLLNPAEKARVIIYHEYGHVLHLVDKRIGKQIDDFLAREKPLASGWQYLISWYGGSSSTIKNAFARQRFNEREFIAESFAIYMHAPESQWFRIHPALLKIFKEADKKP